MLRMHDDLVVLLESDDGFWKQKFIQYFHGNQYDLNYSLNSDIVGWKRIYESLEDFKPHIFIWG